MVGIGPKFDPANVVDFEIIAPIFDEPFLNILRCKRLDKLCIFQAAHFDIPEVLALGRQENWQDWGIFLV